ncbi:uncharacterized protein [Palaemon carinicauda]|uniref:uncharacterized protein n=1 Tax=Palaemon carinicauda TaxID=392227 RepID=UPI0035B61DC6
MNQIGKLQQVEREFMIYGLDIGALSETHCKEIGKETLDQGNTYIYSGRSDGGGREGVGMRITPIAEKALTEGRVVNSRLLLAKSNSKQCNTSIIVRYAPTNDSPKERKDEYYEELQRVPFKYLSTPFTIFISLAVDFDSFVTIKLKSDLVAIMA